MEKVKIIQKLKTWKHWQQQMSHASYWNDKNWTFHKSGTHSKLKIHTSMRCINSVTSSAFCLFISLIFTFASWNSFSRSIASCSSCLKLWEESIFDSVWLKINCIKNTNILKLDDKPTVSKNRNLVLLNIPKTLEVFPVYALNKRNTTDKKVTVKETPLLATNSIIEQPLLTCCLQKSFTSVSFKLEKKKSV